MKFHYVYRITNILLKKYYYGVRSTKLNPKDDLGIKYFSSSSDKEFIKDQKENSQNYRYKIVKVFSTRKSASDFEIYILKKFKANKSDKFYNKAIYCDNSLNYDNSGKMVVKEVSSGRYVQISNVEYLNNKTKYFCNLQVNNFVTAKNTETGKYILVPKIEFDANSLLVGVNKGRISGSNNPMSKIMHIYNHKNELVFTLNGNSKDMTITHNLPYGLFKRSAINKGEPVGLNTKSRTELRKRLKHYYIGWYALYPGDERITYEYDFDVEKEQMLGLHTKLKKSYFINVKSGKNNPNSKRINIYNENDKLMFECHGNIDKIIANNNLPPRIKETYKNNKPLFHNLTNPNRLKHKEFWKFKGWYAKLI